MSRESKGGVSFTKHLHSTHHGPGTRHFTNNNWFNLLIKMCLMPVSEAGIILILQIKKQAPKP